MIKTLNIDGKRTLAITVESLSNFSSQELHDALMEVLETCLSSDEAKNLTSSLSLYILLQLIDSARKEGAA